MTTTASWKHCTGIPLISSSLRNRRRRPVPTEAPPPPAFDLVVTGTLTPDATGNYNEAGTYLGQPYYKRTDDAFYIWFRTVGPDPFYAWTISPGVGTERPIYWRKTGMSPNDPPGNYQPQFSAVGVATVAIP